MKIIPGISEPEKKQRYWDNGECLWSVCEALHCLQPRICDILNLRLKNRESRTHLLLMLFSEKDNKTIWMWCFGISESLKKKKGFSLSDGKKNPKPGDRFTDVIQTQVARKRHPLISSNNIHNIHNIRVFITAAQRGASVSTPSVINSTSPRVLFFLLANDKTKKHRKTQQTKKKYSR